ncbi:MAG: C25 family cysteine peptidase, partial [bacterium]
MARRPGSGGCTIFLLLSAVILAVAGPTMAAQRVGRDGTLSVAIDAGPYSIENTPAGDEVAMQGFGRNLVPGRPDLPAKIFAVAVPPGARVTEVTCDAGEGIELPGSYQVPPVRLPRVVGEENPVAYARDLRTYQDNYAAVYGSNDPYPSEPGEWVRTAGYRKYDLVDVRISPFAYSPQSGALVLYPRVTVNVHYVLPGTPLAEPARVDSLLRTERTARDIIVNYDQAQAWYSGGRKSRTIGLYDFVIITLDSLTTAVQPLVDWETAKGRTVNVVTTSWINTNYTGYDLAEKMRNFLREKYPSGQWGIEDVLLVGHYDDVPMRRCAQDIGYGEPETDYYYAELSLPDSQSWDRNVDHFWGDNVDLIDFYAEVNVGRIPWSTPATVQSICEKSVAYENNTDPGFKRNILLLGAFFWADTDNAVLMEYKVNPTLHPWMSSWTATRLYEQGYSSYPMDYNLTNS